MERVAVEQKKAELAAKADLARIQKEKDAEKLLLEKEAEAERLRKAKETKAAEDLAKQTDLARI